MNPQALAPGQPRDAGARCRPLVAVKDLGWLFYLYPARWLARVLPLGLLYVLWDWLGRWAGLVLRGMRSRLARRMALAFPESSAGELHAMARAWLRNNMLRFLDDLIAHRVIGGNGLSRARVSGLEVLDSALAAGKGGILVSGHFFASRIAKLHLEAAGYPSLSVRRSAPPDRYAGRLGMRWLKKRYLALVGGVLGNEVAYEDPECTLKMLAHLRTGGLIDLHADVRFSREIVRRKIGGEEREFATGYLHLAWIAGCPVVPLHFLGNSRGLAIEVGAPIWPAGWTDRARFVEFASEQVLLGLDERVRRNPEHWDAWIRW